MRTTFLVTAGATALAAPLILNAPTAPVWAVVAVAVAVFGLPHGALDTRVAATHLGLSTRRDFAGFFLLYLAVGALAAASFVAAPVATLAAFLTLAALHFGRDFTDTPAEAIAYGSVVIMAPALVHADAVTAIFSAMAGRTVYADGLAAMAPYSLAVTFGVAAVRRRLGVAAVLAALTGLFVLLPPHVAFAVYFVAHHSPTHFREAARDLGLSTAHALRAALPYALIAGAGMAGAFVLLAASGPVDAAFARTVFVGLLILTAPHMVLETLVETPKARLAVRRWNAGTR